MYYAKGSVIPRRIVKARNQAHQKMATFFVPVNVSFKTVRALKPGDHVIDIAIPKLLKKKLVFFASRLQIICRPPTNVAIHVKYLEPRK